MFFKLLSLLQSSSIVFFGQLVTYTFALGIKEIEYIYVCYIDIYIYMYIYQDVSGHM